MGSCGGAVQLVTCQTVGLTKLRQEKSKMMKVFFLTCLAVAYAQVEPSATIKKASLPVIRARKVKVSATELERKEKSLLNSFPFNAQEHGEHGDHGNKQANLRLNPLIARQGYGEASEQSSPDFAEIADSGKKCVQKVMMVEETVWEDHETCDHSYDKKCHKSFTTTYQSQQEEECDEVFRKICYIEMVDVAHNVTTEVCRKPLVKDCDIEGEIVCRTE